MEMSGGHLGGILLRLQYFTRVCFVFACVCDVEGIIVRSCSVLGLLKLLIETTLSHKQNAHTQQG